MNESKSTYTLLIWEEVPETTRLYLIPTEVADKYRNYLNMAHNKMINASDMNAGMRFLNTAITETKECAEDGFEEYLGIFAEFEKENETPLTGYTILEVYLSGFIL